MKIYVTRQVYYASPLVNQTLQYGIEINSRDTQLRFPESIPCCENSITNGLLNNISHFSNYDMYFLDMTNQKRDALKSILSKDPRCINEIIPSSMMIDENYKFTADILKELGKTTIALLPINLFIFFNNKLKLQDSYKIIVDIYEARFISTNPTWHIKNKIDLAMNEMLLAVIPFDILKEFKLYYKDRPLDIEKRFAFSPEVLIVLCIQFRNYKLAKVVFDNHVVSVNIIICEIISRICNLYKSYKDINNQTLFDFHDPEVCKIMQIMINDSPMSVCRLYNNYKKLVMYNFRKSRMYTSVDNKYPIELSNECKIYCVACAKNLYEFFPNRYTLIALCIAMYYTNNYTDIQLVHNSIYNKKLFRDTIYKQLSIFKSSKIFDVPSRAEPNNATDTE